MKVAQRVAVLYIVLVVGSSREGKVMVIRIHPRYEECKKCHRMYRVGPDGYMVTHPMTFGSSFVCPIQRFEVYHGADQSGESKERVKGTPLSPLLFIENTPTTLRAQEKKEDDGLDPFGEYE